MWSRGWPKGVKGWLMGVKVQGLANGRKVGCGAGAGGVVVMPPPPPGPPRPPVGEEVGGGMVQVFEMGQAKYACRHDIAAGEGIDAMQRGSNTRESGLAVVQLCDRLYALFRACGACHRQKSCMY